MKLSTRLRRTRALMRMASGPASAALIALSYNSRPLWKRLGAGGVLPVRARVRHGGAAFTARFRNVSDFNVCLEVFAEEQYRLPFAPARPVEAVLDLGSNAGFSTAFLALSFPRARIVAVEADPLVAQRSRAMLAQFPNVTVVNAFVSAADGEVEIFRDPNRSISTSRYRRGDNQQRMVVPAISVATLLRQHELTRADLIKFDIEGAEFDVFQAAAAQAEGAVLLGELHPDLAGRSFEEFCALLPGHRFTRIGVGHSGRSVVYGAPAAQTQSPPST